MKKENKYSPAEHFRIEKLIWDNDNLDTKTKITALCLLHHNGKNGCFPEQKTIALETQLSIESVKRAIKILKKLHVIANSRLRRRNNDYWFLI